MATKVFAVVGGTSGLGSHVVKGLATSSTKVFAAGRTLPASVSTNIQYDKVDVTSIRECISYADSIANDPLVKQHGLSGLVLTAGNMNFSLSRQETTEGVEKTFALNYLSKYAIINRLLPALQKSQDGRVVSVMAGGNGGGRVDADDLQMKNGYNCIKQAITTGVLIDMMTVHLASLHQEPDAPKFFHLFPGLMNTNNPTNANLPFYVTLPLKLVFPILAQNPAVIANDVLSLLRDEEYKPVSKSGLLLHPSLKVQKQYSQLDEVALRERVWKESSVLVEKALAASSG
ncbi:hypothetical protein BDR26DRAFT_842132 [Obelidium mucronatum]|nr:hypothetical protein BDR26DRAFT_842132 [Obelidium mucronatum]